MTKKAEFVQGRRVHAAARQFFVDMEVRAHPNDADARLLRVLVDTDSKYSWLPSATLEDLGVVRRRTVTFRTASGDELSRRAGFAYLSADGSQTADLVVFGEAGDPTLIGRHTLAGLNLTADPAAKRLAPSGPVPAPAQLSAPESEEPPAS